MAKSSDGEAQADELSKQEVGYSPDKGLRGRKIYPHHARLPDNYWNEPLQDRTQQGPPWQEYRRPRKGEEEQRDSQNRSIKAWIKPGTEFVFDIHVLNLSKVELGALLWLLSLPEGHFHRFGGGKSLGFGSMRLDMGSCGLLTGDALRRKYTGWQPALDQNPKCSVDSFINAFKEAVVKAYNYVQAFEDVPFIKAFLRACRGFDDGKPVHYPRATADRMASPPSPDGESFKWFVANEKRGNRYALRELWNDPGLPTLEDSQVSGSRTRPRRR